jgi:hypothetical protein
MAYDAPECRSLHQPSTISYKTNSIVLGKKHYFAYPSASVLETMTDPFAEGKIVCGLYEREPMAFSARASAATTG